MEKKDYIKVSSHKKRDFTEQELAETATETALIINDADLGLMAVIPMKNKSYAQIDLYEGTEAHEGQVIDLRKACLKTKVTIVTFNDPDKKPIIREEDYLSF